MEDEQKCIRCGKCCTAIPCSIGLALLGDHRPCLALETDIDGRHSCGLVLHASQYIDLGENIDWKNEFLRKLFSHMLGLGAGCCSNPRYDLIHESFLSRYKNKKPKLKF